MSTAASPRDLFMPQPPGGMGRGLALAVAVHALLVAGLAVGVHWRTSDPTAMQAELWAAVPQVAAPRAAAPEPPPPSPPERPKPTPRAAPPEPPAPMPKVQAPDPQIAIERARREARERQLEAEREAERREAARKRDEAAKQKQAEAQAKAKAEAEADKKRDALAKKREQDDARQAKAEAARIEAARAEAIRRMTAQAGGATGEVGSKGTADRNAAPSDGYAGRVKARIKPNIVFVDDLATNPTAEVLVTLAPDGRILSQKLTRSSGVKEWDQAVQRAIDRTEVFPRDVDGRVPPSILVTFRPRD